MDLPFGIDEFFTVFARYNAAIWPAQLVAYALGALAVAAFWMNPERRKPVILAVLAFLWAWNGVAYHWLIFAPSLEPGDVVILDNLNVHKSPRAAQALAERGAWFLFLPKYSPDLNPIEQAFAKLKTLLRKAKARTYDALWRAVGDICNLFEPQECWNCLKDAGYVAD
jgi:transposase